MHSIPFAISPLLLGDFHALQPGARLRTALVIETKIQESRDSVCEYLRRYIHYGEKDDR